MPVLCLLREVVFTGMCEFLINETVLICICKHSYVVILFNQPSSFAPTGNLAQPNQPVATYDLNQYVSSSGLGPIVAASLIVTRKPVPSFDN